MAFHSSISYVGDKLVVGALDMSFLSPSTRLFPGTLVANGPCYFGMAISPGIPTATVMIGPPIGIGAPLSLRVDGITQINGIKNVFAVSNFWGLTTKFGATIRNALSQTSGINIKNALNLGNAQTQLNGNLNVAGLVTIGGVLTVGGAIACGWLEGQLATARALPGKSFDIPHPTRDGYRLRYGCVEGPELGVYVRGKLEGKIVIQLPDYWKDLVNPDTIPVQLTSDSHYQELSYELIHWGTKVEVKNNLGGAVNCSYLIHGMRKDLEPLITEYEGTSARDYPGEDFLKMGEIYPSPGQDVGESFIAMDDIIGIHEEESE